MSRSLANRRRKEQGANKKPAVPGATAIIICENVCCDKKRPSVDMIPRSALIGFLLPEEGLEQSLTTCCCADGKEEGKPPK